MNFQRNPDIQTASRTSSLAVRANNNFTGNNHIMRTACIMSKVSRVFVTARKLGDDVPVESRYIHPEQRNEVSKTANEPCVPAVRGTRPRDRL